MQHVLLFALVIVAVYARINTISEGEEVKANVATKNYIYLGTSCAPTRIIKYSTNKERISHLEYNFADPNKMIIRSVAKLTIDTSEHYVYALLNATNYYYIGVVNTETMTIITEPKATQIANTEVADRFFVTNNWIGVVTKNVTYTLHRIDINTFDYKSITFTQVPLTMIDTTNGILYFTRPNGLEQFSIDKMETTSTIPVAWNFIGKFNRNSFKRVGAGIFAVSINNTETGYCSTLIHKINTLTGDVTTTQLGDSMYYDTIPSIMQSTLSSDIVIDRYYTYVWNDAKSSSKRIEHFEPSFLYSDYANQLIYLNEDKYFYVGSKFILMYDNGTSVIPVNPKAYALRDARALTSLGDEIYYCTDYTYVPPGERAGGALVSVNTVTGKVRAIEGVCCYYLITYNGYIYGASSWSMLYNTRYTSYSAFRVDPISFTTTYLQGVSTNSPPIFHVVPNDGLYLVSSKQGDWMNAWARYDYPYFGKVIDTTIYQRYCSDGTENNVVGELYCNQTIRNRVLYSGNYTYEQQSASVIVRPRGDLTKTRTISLNKCDYSAIFKLDPIRDGYAYWMCPSELQHVNLLNGTVTRIYSPPFYMELHDFTIVKDNMWLSGSNVNYFDVIPASDRVLQAISGATVGIVGYASLFALCICTFLILGD